MFYKHGALHQPNQLLLFIDEIDSWLATHLFQYCVNYVLDILIVLNPFHNRYV